MTRERGAARQAAYEAADAWLRHVYHEVYMDRLVVEHDLRGLPYPPALQLHEDEKAGRP